MNQVKRTGGYNDPFYFALPLVAAMEQDESVAKAKRHIYETFGIDCLPGSGVTVEHVGQRDFGLLFRISGFEAAR